MPKREIPAPYLGVGDATPFIKQPGDICDPDGMRNLVPENTVSGRDQLATRPKLSSEYAGAVGSGRVNGLIEIPRASGISGVTTVRTTRSTAGSDRPSTPIRGQCIVLEADRTTRAVFSDTRGTGLTTPPGGGQNAGFGGFQCTWHSTDPDIGYFATIAADTANGDTGGKVIVGVNRISLATNTVTHQTYCVDHATSTGPVAGSAHLLSNHLCQYGGYLFVAAYRYIYCFSASNLTYIKRHLIDWTEEVQALAAVTVRGKDWLLALVTGAQNVTSTPVVSDSVGSEVFGEFYRTAILKHEISYANATLKTPVAATQTVLTRRRVPMGLASADAGYEDHQSFRFSEYSAARPRGCIAYGFAAVAGTDGSVHAYVARTNQGWGYSPVLNADQRPDGQAPFISACRAVLTRGFEGTSGVTASNFESPTAGVRYGLSSSVGGWERDIPGGSLRRPYTWGVATYQNDIPIRSGGSRDPHNPLGGVANEPTLWAVAIDAARGQVYFAGRRSSLSVATTNVFCFDTETGDLIWEADVAGVVQQNGIAVDPTTGNVLVAMIRAKGWEQQDGTASTVYAELIELSPEDGTFIAALDLGNDINLNGFITVAVSGTGYNVDTLGSYGVSVNSRGQALVALAPYRYDV